MKRSILFLLLAFALLLSAGQAFAVPRIDSAMPGEGPPGSIIRLEGTDLLRDYRYSDMKVVIAFYSSDTGYWSEGLDTFFMEAQVVLWTYDIVEVRLPGLEERAYVRALGDAPTTLSDSMKDYLNTHRMSGLAYIIGIRSDGMIENFTNSVIFYLTPPPADPVLYRLSRERVTDGEGIAFYGSSFGSVWGEIIFEKEGVEYPMIPTSWASTYALTTVSGLDRGTYDVFVRRGARDSNHRRAIVEVELETAGGGTTMEPARGAGMFAGSRAPGERPDVRIPDSRPEAVGVGSGTVGPVTPSTPLAITNPYCAAYYKTLSPPVAGPELCYLPFFINKGEIRGQNMNSGPPGSFVEINGKCFGDAPVGRKIYMQTYEMLDALELQPLLWSKQKIIVRIPGPERITTSPSGEEIVATFSDGSPDLLYHLDEGPVEARIYIPGIEAEFDSFNFTIEPYAADRVPFICYSAPADITAGDCLKIFGIGLGDGTSSQVLYNKEGVPAVDATVRLWTSTQVNACISEGAGTGANEAIVVKPISGGYLASNKFYLNVLPRINSAMPPMQPFQRGERVEAVEMKRGGEMTIQRPPARSNLEYAGPQQEPLSPLLQKKKKEPPGNSNQLTTGAPSTDSTVDKKKK